MPDPAGTRIKTRRLKFGAVLGVLATISLVVTQLDNILTFFGAKTLASLDGPWLITDKIQQAEGDRFNNLAIQFRVFIQQKGESFTAVGEKVAVNGETLKARLRSKLDISGSISGSQVTATFVETPPEGAGARQSRGSFSWQLVRTSFLTKRPTRMEGSFVSTAADTKGTSIAIREE